MPLDSFIDQQVKAGMVTSEVEVEQLILSAVSERALDRRIAEAEKHIENGQCKQANDAFVKDFIARAGI